MTPKERAGVALDRANLERLAYPTDFAKREAWYEAARVYRLACDAEIDAAKVPESPRAPTVTGATPEACSRRGHGCNSNPCFGCPNA